MDTTPRTVAQLRQDKQLSVQQLAKLTGIPDRILRLIEQRHYLPSAEQVERLCAALGVERDQLDIGLPKTRPGIYGTGGTFM
jgi:transcriptional regulator with XRE-family HTH domain